MENATQALYMAFAVLVFAAALTLTMNMFSQARATSDYILYQEDSSNFIEYQYSLRDKTRVVGLETIIPTLYKYYKENYTVVFRRIDGVNSNDFIASPDFSKSKPLKIYDSNTEENNWVKDKNDDTKMAYDGTNYGLSDKKDVCSFDLDEETKRNEPWTSSVQHIRENLDAFLNGGIFKSPANGEAFYIYGNKDGGTKNVNTDAKIGNNGFIEAFQNSSFLEQMGEYVPDDNEYNSSSYTIEGGGTIIEIDGEQFSLLKQNKKRVIIYTLLE